MMGGALLWVLCSLSAAQAPTFDVVSVKHLAPDSGQPGSNLMRGGPGRRTRPDFFDSATLKRLLMAAYGVEVDQIAGPGWFDSERYAVDAKLPAGTSREQLRQMLQILITERFHAALHRETRVTTGYELTVSRRGAKLTPADPNAPPHRRRPQHRGPHRNGRHAADLPCLFDCEPCRCFGHAARRTGGQPGRIGSGGRPHQPLRQIRFHPGVCRLHGAGRSLPSPDSRAPPADLFDAVETQLGLRLAEKKVPRDVVVVDAIDKTPAGN